MTRITIKEAFDLLTEAYEAGDLENFCEKSKDKGLAGKLIEHALGIPASGANIDCSDGEIKTFQVVKQDCGTLKTNQTIAVSATNTADAFDDVFDDSKYAEKLKTLLLVPKWTEPNGWVSVGRPKLVCLAKEHPILWQRIRNDYHMIRDIKLSGGTVESEHGIILQNRTKGPKNSKTRAFYLTVHFLTEIFTDMQGTKPQKARRIWWDKYKEQKTDEQTEARQSA